MTSTLKANVGAVDQWARMAVGFVLVFLAGIGTIGPWGWIGVIPMATAAIRWCPLYQLLGLSTARPREPARR